MVCRYWDDGVGRLLNDPLHRVCVLDPRSEQVPAATHGGIPGAGQADVCYPIHLATLQVDDITQRSVPFNQSPDVYCTEWRNMMVKSGKCQRMSQQRRNN